MRIMEGLKGDEVRGAEDAERESSTAGGSAAATAQAQSRSKRVLTDYVINGPTLEEVFMNVAREAGAAGGV